MRLIALLLLGGSGTRLWPLSTEQRPKQFLKLFGNRSLFQMTVERLRAAGCDELVVLTNAAHAGHVAEEMAQLGAPMPPVVLEPARRDSGPAIAAGVAYARARWGPDLVIAAFPADHLIPTELEFGQALQKAVDIAAAGRLVTFGIRPTYPATTYGYIQRGRALAGAEGAFDVANFHEKPNQATAEAYVAAGDYDWNSGMFVFRANAFVSEASAHMPDIWDSAESAAGKGVQEGGYFCLDATAFATARKSSIDYALFEKSRLVATMPAGFRWSDIGNWASVYEALEKDREGNVVIGDVRCQHCSGSLILADGVSAAVTGLTDMVMICTQDGSFAAPRERAADIKQLIGG